MAVLSGLLYRLTAEEEHREALQTILAQKERCTVEEARRAELLMRELRDMTCVPEAEHTAYRALVVEASSCWRDARAANDFRVLEPMLGQIVEHQRRRAAYRDSSRPAYDVLLDGYEKGNSMARLDPFFEALRRDLTPLVLAVKERPQPEKSFLVGGFPVHEQQAFALGLMELMGIDRERCGLAVTEHPYTHAIDNKNVRITTRFQEDVSASMYSVIHEGGHALYELGVEDRYQGTALQGGASMSIHESQSRFYENIIGRSLPFCRAVLPVMLRLWPERLKGVTPGLLYAAVCRAEPTLVRTEADELTYPMHIMVRYELEKGLFAGEIGVHELPGLWAEMYHKYLGLEVPDDLRGVLQDVHWPDGLWGYFPSYALGNAYGAQMLKAMEETVDVWGSVEKGDLRPVNGWLREKIHRHGRLMEPAELLLQATGTPIDPGIYTGYLKRKYTALYDL